MATKSRSKSRTNNAQPFTILGDTLESAAESFEEASVNANDSARRAARATKRALGTGVYNAFYGLSFGIVFSGVFITELLPEGGNVRRALTDGADSALRNREKAREAKKAKKALKSQSEEMDELSEELDATDMEGEEGEEEAMEHEPVAKPKSRKRPSSKVSARTRSAVEHRAEEFDNATAELAI